MLPRWNYLHIHNDVIPALRKAGVTEDQLDTPLTFEGTRAIGATLGSGVIMLFDDTIDLKQILVRIAAFFRFTYAFRRFRFVRTRCCCPTLLL